MNQGFEDSLNGETPPLMSKNLTKTSREMFIIKKKRFMFLEGNYFLVDIRFNFAQLIEANSSITT